MNNRTLANLDAQHRLQPWIVEEHRVFVVQQYAGMIITDPKRAAVYLKEYQKKEKEAKAAYKDQQKQYIATQIAMGLEKERQTVLEEPKYLDWDPETAMDEARKKREELEKASEQAEKDRVKRQKEDEKRHKAAKKVGEERTTAKTELEKKMDAASTGLPTDAEGGDVETLKKEFKDLSADDQRAKLVSLGVPADADMGNSPKRLALYLAKVSK